MRTATRRTPRVRLAMALALSSAFAVMLSAVGDYFIPLPAPSEINVLSAPHAFAPDQETSDTSYTLSIGVTNEAGFENVARVFVCWYDDVEIDYGVGPVRVDPSNCLVDSTMPDERYAAVMYWDGTFHVGQLNHESMHDDYYRDAQSEMRGNGNTGTWDFKFTVSEAMHKSDMWRAYIEVCDAANQCSVDQSITGVSVAWYGYMVVPVQQADFDIVGINSWSFAVRDEGRPMANGAAFGTYESTNFKYDNNIVALMNTGLPGSVATAGKVALDCTPNSMSYAQAASNPANPDFGGQNWIRVTNQPQRAYENAFAEGRYEDGGGGSIGWFGCGLYYPGGAAAAGVRYESTFTVGIGEYTDQQFIVRP